MTKEVKIPQISEDADVATVSEIHVSEGDEISQGDDLIAVDSDKASVDIPNEEGDGTVKEIKVKKGDEVHVGDVILILETEGDGEDDSEDEKDQEEEGEEKKKEEDSSEGEEKDEDEHKEEDGEDKEENDGGEADEDEKEKEQEKGKRDKPKAKEDDEDEDGEEDDDGHDGPAAPLAKKFARELGIDIKDLQTDDPDQRITREDVMKHAKKLIESAGKSGEGDGAKASGGIEPIKLPDFSQWGETEREPLSGIRAAVAKNTRISWQNIPHVTQHDRADLTELQAFREKLAEQDKKLSITAMMAKICLAALQKFPRFNSSLDIDEKELIIKKYYNIGIAVDTPDGLLMPVIKNAEQKSLEEMNEELVELAKKARDRKLKPDEMKGGNFTISNLGGIGGTHFTPVIFPPQVAILGMSTSSIEPMWIEDEFVPAEMTTLSLSYDHRVIDGADAARFLRWICEVIEEPFNLLK